MKINIKCIVFHPISILLSYTTESAYYAIRQAPDQPQDQWMQKRK